MIYITGGSCVCCTARGTWRRLPGKAELKDMQGNVVEMIDSEGRQVSGLEVDVPEVLDLEHKASRMNLWYPQRGPRRMGRMQAIVKSPHRWTSETPNLYKLHLTLMNEKGEVVQQIEQRVGFRIVEIKTGRCWSMALLFAFGE